MRSVREEREVEWSEAFVFVSKPDFFFVCRCFSLQLQIRAWFSEDGSKVICGGENHHIYVWSAAEYQSGGLRLLAESGANGGGNGSEKSDGGGAGGKDEKKSGSIASASASSKEKPDVKCDSSESFRAFTDTCTSAQFLPQNTIRLFSDTEAEASKTRHLMVAAGYQGDLKFFANMGGRKPT
jgi:hypothetical protein